MEIQKQTRYSFLLKEAGYAPTDDGVYIYLTEEEAKELRDTLIEEL